MKKTLCKYRRLFIIKVLMNRIKRELNLTNTKINKYLRGIVLILINFHRSGSVSTAPERPL